MVIRPDHHETPTNPADEAAVRDLYQQLIAGWNRGSGAAFAAVFAEDGDLVAYDGTRFRGRQQIAPFHQELFDKWLQGSRLVGQVEDVRFLSRDVAVMHAVGGTVMRGKPNHPRSATRSRPSSPRVRAANGASPRSRIPGSGS